MESDSKSINWGETYIDMMQDGVEVHNLLWQGVTLVNWEEFGQMVAFVAENATAEQQREINEGLGSVPLFQPITVGDLLTRLRVANDNAMIPALVEPHYYRGHPLHEGVPFVAFCVDGERSVAETRRFLRAITGNEYKHRKGALMTVKASTPIAIVDKPHTIPENDFNDWLTSIASWFTGE